MRVQHEYARGGALAYLAACDVHRAKVFGRCEATTGIDPFNRLIDQVMTCEPYASARRVFWVVDNGSSHRGQASIDRLQHRWPVLRLIHLPVHQDSRHGVCVPSVVLLFDLRFHRRVEARPQSSCEIISYR